MERSQLPFPGPCLGRGYRGTKGLALLLTLRLWPRQRQSQGPSLQHPCRSWPHQEGAFLSQVGALVVLPAQGVFCVPPSPRHPWDSFFPSLLVLWVMLETSTGPPRLNSPGLQFIVRVQVLASTFLAV